MNLFHIMLKQAMKDTPFINSCTDTEVKKKDLFFMF